MAPELSPAVMSTQVERPWWFIALIGRNPKRTGVRILFLIAFCVLAWKFAVVPIRVEGISMLPTYRNGQINFINRLAYAFHPPQRGDVVAIRMGGERVMLLKRIVGLPGETVEFKDGQLLVNGQPLNEPYLKLPCTWNVEPQRDGFDEYYVVGDNRSMPDPADHTKGRAERWRIVGKTML